MLVKENICVSPKLESVIIRSDDVSSSKTVLMKVIKTDVKFVNVRKKIEHLSEITCNCGALSWIHIEHCRRRKYIN
jgi:hypothetical protein